MTVLWMLILANSATMETRTTTMSALTVSDSHTYICPVMRTDAPSRKLDLLLHGITLTRPPPSLHFSFEIPTRSPPMEAPNRGSGRLRSPSATYSFRCRHIVYVTYPVPAPANWELMLRTQLSALIAYAATVPATSLPPTATFPRPYRPTGKDPPP